MSAARRWLARPVVHFLLAGAALYLFSLLWYRRGPGDAAANRGPIVVTQARVAQLRDEFAREFGATPTAKETAALIDGEVESEMLYREALARGLDQGDAAIRWRLLQKMRFIGEGDDDKLLSEAKELRLDRDDVVIRRILAEKLRLQVSVDARMQPPGDAEIERYLAAHRDLFTAPARARFQHVFLSRDRRGAAVDGDAAELLQELRGSDDAGPSPTGAFARATPLRGDAFPLGNQYDGSQAQIARLFGPDIAARVFELDEGRWEGPLPSPYGLHLVKVEARAPAREPTLESVRSLVERRIIAERVETELSRFVSKLRGRYEVRVEPSASVSYLTTPARAVS